MAKEANNVRRMLENKNLFDGFVCSPKESRNAQFSFRNKYFDKGVIFDFNLDCDEKTNFKLAKKELSLKQDVAMDKYSDGTVRAAFYKPATFEELSTCLQNTQYTAFARYLCGEKAQTNFVRLIDSFIKNNLQEQVDSETVTAYTSQIYSLITEEKGPQLYASRVEMYERNISEILEKREAFVDSYQGKLPTVEDYAYVRLVEGRLEDDNETSEGLSVEEIVKNIYLSKGIIKAGTEENSSESNPVFEQ